MRRWARRDARRSVLPMAWCVSRWASRICRIFLKIWNWDWLQSKTFYRTGNICTGSTYTFLLHVEPSVSDPGQSREWNSSVYHRLSQPQVSWGRRVLSRLRLRGDEQLLDAGCGTGRLTAELIAALPRGRVVGADLSRNMLMEARDHLRGAH